MVSHRARERERARESERKRERESERERERERERETEWRRSPSASRAATEACGRPSAPRGRPASKDRIASWRTLLSRSSRATTARGTNCPARAGRRAKETVLPAPGRRLSEGDRPKELRNDRRGRRAEDRDITWSLRIPFAFFRRFSTNLSFRAPTERHDEPSASASWGRRPPPPSSSSRACVQPTGRNRVQRCVGGSERTVWLSSCLTCYGCVQSSNEARGVLLMTRGLMQRTTRVDIT
jgi:hypothetical protein